MKQFAILIALSTLLNLRVQAEPVTPKRSIGFDVNIKNGQLELNGLTNFPAVLAALGYHASDHNLPVSIQASLPNLVIVMQAMDTNANFIIEPDIKGIQIEELKYHCGTNSYFYLPDIIQILSAASGKQFILEAPMGGFYDLRKNPMASHSNSAKPDFDVFNLNSYFLMATIIDDESKQKAVAEIEEEVDNAIDIVSTQLPETKRPLFSFHSKTGLLVVFGNEPSREVVRKFVAALNQSPFSNLSTNK